MDAGALEKLTECPLCLETFREPRTLPCQHSFCEHCLEQHVRVNMLPGGFILCPNCRRKLRVPEKGVAGFPHNFLITNLLDALDQHDDRSEDDKPLKGSAPPEEEATQQEEAPPGGCGQHPGEDITLYCKTCGEGACGSCGSEYHTDHRIVDLQQEVLRTRQYIGGSLDSLNAQREAVRNLRRMDVELENVRDSAGAARGQLQRKRDQVFRKIDEYVERMVEEIERECAETEAHIVAKQEEKEVVIGQIEGCMENLGRLTFQVDPAADMRKLQDMESRIMFLTLNDVSKLDLDRKVRWQFESSDIVDADCHQLIGKLKVNRESIAKVTPSAPPMAAQEELNTGYPGPPSTGYPGPPSTGYPGPPPIEQPEALPESLLTLLPTPELVSSIQCETTITDLALCKDSTVLVLPKDSSVKMYTDRGMFVRELIRNYAANLQSAKGVSVLPDCNIAVSDKGGKDIKVYSQSGSFIKKFGVGAGIPFGIAALNNGSMAVCYPGFLTICVFQGNPFTVRAGIEAFTLPKYGLNGLRPKGKVRLRRPWYVAAYQHSGLIVSDRDANAIYAFREVTKETHNDTCSWMYGGTQGSDPGMLNDPHGVVADHLGNVLVADTRNNRVLLVYNNGWGSHELLTTSDGIYQPLAVAVNKDTVAVGQQNGSVLIFKYKAAAPNRPNETTL